MSVEQLDVVDIVSTDKSGSVVLTISDHLDWSNTLEHQAKLQAKLNKYLAFIDSGEILTRYPDAHGRRITIRIVFRYRPDPEGWRFLSKAREVVAGAGFGLHHEIFAESYDN